MKFIVAVLAGLFGATSVMAADLPASVYTKARRRRTSGMVREV
jgi:hypothetical protein